MKNILVLLIIGAGAYFFYTRHTRTADPVEMAEAANPAYVEVRMAMPVENRKLDLVLFGKMTSLEDCEKRNEKESVEQAWEKMLEGCPTCTIQVSRCLATLEPRYLRLFADQPINGTYMAFTRADAREFDGRMVFWGVTADEGNLVCEKVRVEFVKRYRGTVTCVAGKPQ